MTDEPVVIGRRFNGPAASGHGGWSAGQAGLLLEGSVAEVTLRRPPPLETPLAVARRGATTMLLHGADVVVEARPAELVVDGPDPVGVAQAAVAARHFAWEHDHPFPTCFGCGPQRDPADALCLYTGPVGDGRFAVPWTPPAWTGDGDVDPHFLWAALDCPSSAPVHGTISSPVVLGRFTVAIEGAVAVGEPHVIQAWLERSDGRKRHTAVALHTAAGERRAAGRAVWIELARPLGS